MKFHEAMKELTENGRRVKRSGWPFYWEVPGKYNIDTMVHNDDLLADDWEVEIRPKHGFDCPECGKRIHVILTSGE